MNLTQSCYSVLISYFVFCSFQNTSFVPKQRFHPSSTLFSQITDSLQIMLVTDNCKLLTNAFQGFCFRFVFEFPKKSLYFGFILICQTKFKFPQYGRTYRHILLLLAYNKHIHIQIRRILVVRLICTQAILKRP